MLNAHTPLHIHPPPSCSPDKIDTCQGDSGGPLVLRGKTPADDMLVGITSWGQGCASGYPGVYADVAWAAPWIRSTITYLLAEEAVGRLPPAYPSTAP